MNIHDLREKNGTFLTVKQRVIFASQSNKENW